MRRSERSFPVGSGGGSIRARTEVRRAASPCLVAVPSGQRPGARRTVCPGWVDTSVGYMSFCLCLTFADLGYRQALVGLTESRWLPLRHGITIPQPDVESSKGGTGCQRHRRGRAAERNPAERPPAGRSQPTNRKVPALARYDYLCVDDGAFEVNLPIGQAQPTTSCPTCGGDTTRRFTPPHTTRVPRNVAGLLDKTERSRHEPEVVSSLPRRPPHQRTPTAPSNPALRKLPRP